ncbi:thiamine pyrophosphate-binding protein [Albimonas sp. CAU 1670]|uniref:thiamine pyrophosphate-dependent enzyme n=1 Tax=Albimonas sp. CAU 1670 TaxID=3032599 RepID=UPI0023D9C468|nr:thiamine pyrophosphate-dependent enzyme [Albimonas sp. CAU 1670]MDF2235269.1 thiamine pyrophosphate-binding protein [Albimonas sp. CAU 1670]
MTAAPSAAPQSSPNAPTGGEIAVESLLANGVDTLFALPGVQLDHLMNALHGATDRLRVIHPRHEQGAAYMALGYAMATGRVGAYAVVPGPGFLNTTAALSTAYAVHAPVLAVIGQIASKAIGQGGGELHELPDQSAILDGLTRSHGIAREAGEVAGVMQAAFAALASGRAPAGVELPADVLRKTAEGATVAPAARAVPAPDAVAMDEAAALLAGAKRPLIWIGSGALACGEGLAEIAARIGAPVVSHLTGVGVLPTDHPWAVGTWEGRELWREADVILAVGTRLHDPRRRWGVAEGQAVIRVDLDPAQFSRGAPPTVAIEADAAEAIPALAQALAGAEIAADVSARQARTAELKAAKAAIFEERLAPQMAYLRAIRAALPMEAAVVCDYTQIGYAATAALPMDRPRRLITPGYQGTLGFAYATALGVKAGLPDAPVVALCGDGGFLFTGAEMATAVQHGINAVGIVFSDGAYGNVRRMQDQIHGGKLIASDLRNPDFVAYAQSFGAEARRAEGPEALGEALAWAITRPGPVLIECPMPVLPDPWELLEPR